jgi:hypothetical protein
MSVLSDLSEFSKNPSVLSSRVSLAKQTKAKAIREERAL